MMFRAALGFFTRLPVGSSSLPATFHGMIVWLPVIGLIIGAFVALAVWSMALLLPAPLCGIVGCLVWVAITGGLHLDGVADCGDGLVVEAPPARRLEIMKDSRLGTFGGIALFFILMFKTLALYALAETGGTGAGFLFSLLAICCMTSALARSMVFIAMRLPSARPEGLGQAVAAGVAPRQQLLSFAVGPGLCILNGACGIAALAAALLVTWFLLSAARKRLGGITGDVYGCLIELSECAILLAVCMVSPFHP